MKLLDVQPGEAPSVFAVGLLSFLVGLPRVFTFTAASAAFVEHVGPEALPFAYGLGALLVAGLGLLYVRLERRRGLLSAAAATFAAFAVTLGLAGGALHRQLAVPGVAFALVLIAEAEFTLTNITFWNVAGRAFTSRQAARLFGFVSAGQTIPAILGGLAIPGLVRAVSTEGLLMGSVLGHLLATGFVLQLPRWLDGLGRPAPAAGGPGRPVSHAERSNRSEAPRPLRALLARPYLRQLAILLGLQVVVFFAVDNAFFFAVEDRLGPGEPTASFLGRFLVALGICNLLFRLGLAGRWRRWFGLRTALASTPATLLVLAALTVLARSGGAQAWTVFGLVVVLKLWERLSVDAIHSPSFYSLFLPLPAGERVSAQSTLESVVAQLATLGTSLGLIVLVDALGLELDALLVATAVACAVWFAFSLAVARGYREILQSTLASRRVEPGALPIADSTTLDLIAQETRSESPARVLRSLEILDALDAKDLPEVAAELLDHDSPRVVAAAAELLRRRPSVRLVPVLRRRVERGAPPFAMARLLRAYAAAAHQAAIPLLRDRLSGPPEVRAAAAAALLDDGGVPGRALGRRAFAALARDPDPEARARGADALAAAADPETIPLLVSLLEDPEVEVARAAARAAGAISGDDARLDGALSTALERPGLLDAAARSLARRPGPALAERIRARLGRGPPTSARTSLALQAQLRILAADAGASEEILALGLDDPGLRRATLEGLEQRPGPLPETLRVRLETLLEAGLAAATSFVQAPAAPGADRRGRAEDAFAIRAALDRRFELVELLLLLLGRLFDAQAIREARRHRGSGQRETAALALELVEAAVPEPVGLRVLPLLEAELSGRPVPLEPWGPGTRGLRSPPGPSFATGLPEEIAEEGLRALARVPLLEHLRIEHLGLLLERAPPRPVAAGTPYSELGHPGALLVPLDSSEPIELDADLALLRPGAPPAAAAPRAGRYLVLEAEHLRDLFEDLPEAAWRILEHLCQRAQGDAARHATPEPARESETALPYVDLLRRMSELERFPQLAGVSTRVLAAVARSAREMEFAGGEALIVEGALDSTLVLLLDGPVEVSKAGATLARLTGPALFGELAAIVPAPRSASVVATDLCRALVLPREALYALLLEEHGVLTLLIDLVVERLRRRPNALAEAGRAGPRQPGP